MKIEEAILYCLTSQNRGMRTEQIAEMINRQRLHIRKYIDMVLNKQQLSVPGGKTPEKESVLKKLEEAKAAQFQKKTEQKNHTQEL